MLRGEGFEGRRHVGNFEVSCWDRSPNVMPPAASATLRDVLKPDDQAWLRERFRVAAHNRHLHLAAACDASTACPGAHSQCSGVRMRCHPSAAPALKHPTRSLTVAICCVICADKSTNLVALPQQLFATAAVDATVALVHSLDKHSRGALRKRPVDHGRKAASTFFCTTDLVKVRNLQQASCSSPVNLIRRCSWAGE